MIKILILRDGIEIGELKSISCLVKYNSKSKVKRACQIRCNTKESMKTFQQKVRNFLYPSQKTFPSPKTFTVKNEYDEKAFVFDKIRDRIKIIYDDKPIGVFMVISAPVDDNGLLETYDLECYDESMKLEQNQIEDRLFIAKDTSYLSAIKRLLVEKGFTLIISDDTTATMQSDREWEAGSNLLDIVNELLKEINFCEFHIDSNGYAKLIKKNQKDTPDFIYKKGKFSVIKPQTKSKLDIYNVPNVFVGVVSNPDIPLLMYKLINDKVDSVISTVNRGYEVTKFYKLSNIASQIELEAFIKDEFNNSLQQTETIEFSTKKENGHEFQNTVQVETNNIQGLFVETQWSIDLSLKGDMKHVAERRVFI